ncbi:hypothetical protein TNCV_3157441 [Trichonephila clavipes]|nr:hypothetical protein TNCV_3157441 [Trichonephila clavipes]
MQLGIILLENGVGRTLQQRQNNGLYNLYDVASTAKRPSMCITDVLCSNVMSPQTMFPIFRVAGIPFDTYHSSIDRNEIHS